MNTEFQSIQALVYATNDEKKIKFFSENDVQEYINRNMYATSKCKHMLTQMKKMVQDGYTFKQNVPDIHSRIKAYKNGVEYSVRLCKNPYCRFYHSEKFKRTQIVCLEHCFRVCKYQGDHDNKVHCTLDSLPSYCINSVHKK